MVVGSLACNFGGGALRSVDAHSIGHRMGTDPALHCTAARGEGRPAELGGEEGRSKHNFERVNDEPLLLLLEEVAEQGFVDCRQLARPARVQGHLPALEELVVGVNCANPCPFPLGEVRSTHAELFCGSIERLPPQTKAPCRSQEAILPACVVADAPFSAIAARLDDGDHYELKL